MKLAPNWRSIIRRAWSFRLALVAAALGGVEIALPLFSDTMPRGWFLAASVTVTVLAAAARIVAQPGMDDD